MAEMGAPPSGDWRRHARLQPVLAADGGRRLQDAAPRRRRAAAGRKAGRPQSQVHAGGARLGRERRLGVRGVPPRDARQADHRQRRTSVRVGARAAREPRSTLRQQLFLRVQQVLAPGEQPVDENDTRERAVRRAATGFVDAEVRSGRYTEADRLASIEAWLNQDRRRRGSITIAPTIATRPSTTPPGVDHSTSWSA